METRRNVINSLQLALTISCAISSSESVFASDNFQIWGDPAYGNDMYTEYIELPDSIRNYFSNIGCNIVVVDGEYGADSVYQQYGWQVPGSILGFATEEWDGPYNYSVYAEGGDHDGYYEKYPESSNGLTPEDFNYRIDVSTLYHELGHVMDWNGILSNSGEFANIYYTDVENFKLTREYTVNNFNVYTNIANTLEYFATAFACYINYPDDLYTYYPDTYNYFNSFFNAYSESDDYSNGLIQ